LKNLTPRQSFEAYVNKEPVLTWKPLTWNPLTWKHNLKQQLDKQLENNLKTQLENPPQLENP
jgi:hypothetical protein